jgi:hypothetical protein
MVAADYRHRKTVGPVKRDDPVQQPVQHKKPEPGVLGLYYQTR